MIGNRRDEPRFAADEIAELRWHDAAGAEQRCSGKMLDLSRSGARLRLDRPIRLGTPAELTVRGRQLPAQVRYCARAGAEYIVGIEFRPESQGNSGAPGS